MTTNKFYNDTSALSVYIANLGEYTNGKLVGDWISLPIEEDDFKDFLKTIGNPEEIAVHDFEDNSGLEGVEIGEYMSLKELNELAEHIENINIDEICIVNALYVALEDFAQALDYYEANNYVYYGDMTLEEIAQEHIEEYYDIPEVLKQYIDYRLYARDMDIEGYYYTTNYGTIEIL